MPRLLAIDLGTKRTGIAITDELQISTRPLPLIAHQSQQELLTALALLVKQYKITTVILGLPLSSDGSEGPQAKLTRDFGTILQNQNLSVIYHDESFSSQDAALTQKKKINKNKRSLDSIAAKIILDDYLKNQP